MVKHLKYYGFLDTQNQVYNKTKFKRTIRKLLNRSKRKGHMSIDRLNQGTTVYKRNRVISAKQLEKEVKVYNGRRYIPIKITYEKIGRKYADFVFTKRMGHNIHANIIQKKRRR